MTKINLFELYASLTLDTEGYERGLDEAGTKTNSFGSRLKSGLASAAKFGAQAITAVTAAATALGGVLVAQTAEVASYGDNIDKMSQKMGLSATAYQEWDAIMQHSGTSIESLQAGMKTLANAVENGNDAFGRLGISQEQIASMDNEQLFSATIAALQGVESETERTYLAGQLLGRGATELGALLNMSAEETEQMRLKVHELGGVMSDDAVKAAAHYSDSLQDLKTAFSGIKRGLVSEMLPAVTTVMDGLTEIFVGNGDAGVDMISDGLSSVVDNITEALPKILDIGSRITTQLMGAIVSNLPKLVGAGTQMMVTVVQGVLEQLPQIVSSAAEIISTFFNAIMEAAPTLLQTGMSVLSELVNGIIDGIPHMIARLPKIIDGFLNFVTKSLPTILSSGGQMLSKLATGIISAIPKLVSQLPQIITSIVNFITSNLPLLVQSGISLTIELAAGIIQAIPQLIAAAPQLITAFISGVNSVLGSVASIGVNIVNGVWNGIQSMIGEFTNKVRNFFSGIVNSVKAVLGIKSPSKVFAEIGGFMAEGLSEGWDDQYSHIKKSIEDDMEFGTANVGISAVDRQTQAISGLTGAVLAGSNNGGGNYEIVIRVGDSDLARVLFDPLRNVVTQRGESFA